MEQEESIDLTKRIPEAKLNWKYRILGMHCWNAYNEHGILVGSIRWSWDDGISPQGRPGQAWAIKQTGLIYSTDFAELVKRIEQEYQNYKKGI